MIERGSSCGSFVALALLSQTVTSHTIPLLVVRIAGCATMEGPTPVSALIHAATMVTAGVFLLARCSPLLEYCPEAVVIISLIGGMTVFFAATTAYRQVPGSFYSGV